MILKDNFILIGNKNTIFAQLLHLTERKVGGRNQFLSFTVGRDLLQSAW